MLGHLVLLFFMLIVKFYIFLMASSVSLLFSDIVLYLCEKEHVECGMIFQLLEDLTEMSTMKNCKDIFGYIESKQDILGKVSVPYKLYNFFLGFYHLFYFYNIYFIATLLWPCIFLGFLWLHLMQQELFARGKLVMLRTCNQLLRRLSKVHWILVMVIASLRF